MTNYAENHAVDDEDSGGSDDEDRKYDNIWWGLKTNQKGNGRPLTCTSHPEREIFRGRNCNYKIRLCAFYACTSI